MNRETGEIINAEVYEKLKGEMFDQESRLKKYMEMEIPPTEKQLKRKPPKVGRNEPCPCNSGKKFKKCCYITKPQWGI